MFDRRHFLTLTAALPLAVLTARAAKAATPPIYAEGGIAVDGSDVVAYFTQAEPVAGRASESLMWQGVEWRFASAENRALFEADPEAYAPQYGGYCAFAVSQGYTASTVPEAWTVHEGKLYLNFSRSVRRRWLRDIDGHIAAANDNWPSVLEA